MKRNPLSIALILLAIASAQAGPLGGGLGQSLGGSIGPRGIDGALSGRADQRLSRGDAARPGLIERTRDGVQNGRDRVEQAGDSLSKRSTSAQGEGKGELGLSPQGANGQGMLGGTLNAAKAPAAEPAAATAPAATPAPAAEDGPAPKPVAAPKPAENPRKPTLSGQGQASGKATVEPRKGQVGAEGAAQGEGGIRR